MTQQICCYFSCRSVWICVCVHHGPISQQLPWLVSMETQSSPTTGLWLVNTGSLPSPLPTLEGGHGPRGLPPSRRVALMEEVPLSQWLRKARQRPSLQTLPLLVCGQGLVTCSRQVAWWGDPYRGLGPHGSEVGRAVPESCGQCGTGGREQLLPLAVGSTSIWERRPGEVGKGQRC